MRPITKKNVTISLEFETIELLTRVSKKQHIRKSVLVDELLKPLLKMLDKETPESMLEIAMKKLEDELK